ncbi:MAG: trypsin-like serine protease [Bdellovibrionaceae bacterium]|nr:trypsin-like serine protease [Pseudobdellovibrionaceae bacterium]
MKRLVVSVASLFAFLAPVYAQVDSLVQNGSTVGTSSPLNQSVARLRMGGSSCSGSFISSRTILTAAHCLKGRVPSGVEVQVRGPNGSWFSQRAARLVVHPNYKITSDASGAKTRFDFALINLATKMGTTVRPVTVVDPGGSSGWFRVTVAGFGYNAQGSGAGVLRTGAMHAQAKGMPEFFGDRGLYMVPVSSQATCPGDSGGPVFIDGSTTQQIGVHSLSSGCQGGDALSYSAIPSQVVSWIRTNTQ